MKTEQLLFLFNSIRRKPLTISALLFLAAVLFSNTLPAQDHGNNPHNTDQMFFQARELAFEGETQQARQLCREILEINSAYHDATVLMARTYGWDEEYEEGLELLTDLLAQEPRHIEALLAMSDLQRWAGNYQESLHYANLALELEPENTNLLMRKAKALIALEEYEEAAEVLNKVLETDPTLEEADNLLDQVARKTMKNHVGVGYRVDLFDDANPWHLFYAEYGQRTNTFGKVIGRVNYGRRFGQDGFQVEADAYPPLGPGRYLYLNAGYSPDDHIFPKYRAGLELFQRLPADWEISAGLRMLRFAETDLLILTGSISKYYGKYYFSFRPYFTLASDMPGAQSYFLTLRRYFTSPDHHLSLILGTGFSADEDALVGGQIYDIESNRIMLMYQQIVSGNFLVKAGAGYSHYQDEIWGNQYTLEAGVAYLF